MKKILVLALEVSGDIHGAEAISRFQKIYPHIPLSLTGLGGEYLEKVGVRLLERTTSYGQIGYLESLTSIFPIFSLFQRVKKWIYRERPDLILLVDSPGFNLRILPLARKLGIPALIYFGPSAWIWGQRRAKKVVKEEALIAAIFKPEEELYQSLGGQVYFVGHPIRDLMLDKKKIQALQEKVGPGPFLGLLPGSRKKEVEALLPVLLEASSLLKEAFPSLSFLLPLASNVSFGEYGKMLERRPDIQVVEDSSLEVMALSTLILTASGTATLEAAVIGVPMIILYRVSPFTAFMGRKVGIERIGMSNILLGREVVPEILQEDLNKESLFEAAKSLLSNPGSLEEMAFDLSLVKEKLGPPGSLDRMATLLKDLLGEG